MDALPPIPVPLWARWREFRTRVLPFCLIPLTMAVAALLWRYENAYGNFPGLAEGIRITISSPQPGVIRALLVQPYQIVQAGDPVAIVVPNDPRTEFDVLQAELDLVRLRGEPTVPQQHAMDYEKLRFDLLRMKSELAGAKVNLQRAENEVRRQAPLFEGKLVSEDIYDLAVKTRDSILAEWEAKNKAAGLMEQRLEDLRWLGEPESQALANSPRAFPSSLLARHRAIITNLGPITLTAPIAGMVSSVNRQPGEQVLAGESVAVVSSPHAERVVAYLRQPYSFQPEVGTEVLVTTREWKRRRFLGSISQVGVQVECVTNSLAVLRPGTPFDTGLPVVIDLSPEARIRPGEIVDVAVGQRPVEPAVSQADPAARRDLPALETSRAILQ